MVSKRVDANATTHLWTFEVGFTTKMEVLETAFAESLKSCDLFNYVPPEDIIELSTLLCQAMQCLVQDSMKLYGPASTSLRSELRRPLSKLLGQAVAIVSTGVK